MADQRPDSRTFDGQVSDWRCQVEGDRPSGDAVVGGLEHVAHICREQVSQVIRRQSQQQLFRLHDRSRRIVLLARVAWFGKRADHNHRCAVRVDVILGRLRVIIADEDRASCGCTALESAPGRLLVVHISVKRVLIFTGSLDIRGRACERTCTRTAPVARTPQLGICQRIPRLGSVRGSRKDSVRKPPANRSRKCGLDDPQSGWGQAEGRQGEETLNHGFSAANFRRRRPEGRQFGRARR